VCVLDKLYFQRSSAHTFDTLYCVKSATLHVSAFPRPSSGVPFYNIENISLHNVARTTRWFKYDPDKLWLVYTQSVPVIFEPPCISIKIEKYKLQIFKLQYFVNEIKTDME
jgi:hypothetical protein